MKLSARALHFVFKIADRSANIAFYKDILGMKVLRHEEFMEGCDAQCNGAYNNRWSKTMVGYGPEDNHFVVELTYNYPVKSYKRGNDFRFLTIQSSEAAKSAREARIVTEEGPSFVTVSNPDGHAFKIIDKPQVAGQDPVLQVTLSCSDLKQTILYWNGTLGMEILSQEEKSVAFTTGANQAKLAFIEIGEKIEHAESYGRIAFAVPTEQLASLQNEIDSKGHKILTRLVSLDTPGKATVSVVILADPDGHEICFVGDEGFRQLSQVDPKAGQELDKFIKLDKS